MNIYITKVDGVDLVTVRCSTPDCCAFSDRYIPSGHIYLLSPDPVIKQINKEFAKCPSPDSLRFKIFPNPEINPGVYLRYLLSGWEVGCVPFCWKHALEYESRETQLAKWADCQIVQRESQRTIPFSCT